MWPAIEMLAGAFTRGSNDTTEQLYAHSQHHKQVRDTFRLILKKKKLNKNRWII